MRKFFLCAIFGLLAFGLGAKSEKYSKTAADQKFASEPCELEIFRTAYPDFIFFSEFDFGANDWKITVQEKSEGNSLARTAEFFWCDGRLLPSEKILERKNFWKMFYNYPREVPDPKNFSAQDVERIRAFSSPQNRTQGSTSPQFFYDFIYDCKTRANVERHIVQIEFLGKKSCVHEKIAKVLFRVENEIRQAAKIDFETQEFLRTLLSADSYNWREISDSGKRSFHSMGIAIDVLPRGWGQKNVYWAWRRDADPQNWMLLPLERRWMPPPRVVQIFEKHGFLWGGKWTIWDNMHFEFRPEVILHNFGTDFFSKD